jgi:hypothetical protein
MRGGLFALVLFAAGSVMASESPLPALALVADERSTATSVPMGYFATSTTSLDIKSLPGMVSFHGAYITPASFTPATGQCNVFLAIEPTSSQVTYRLGLRSVYSALETTLTVMAANGKHPQKLKNYMAEAGEAAARRAAADEESLK